MWSRSNVKRYASTYLNDTAMNKFWRVSMNQMFTIRKTAEFAAENFALS